MKNLWERVMLAALSGSADHCVSVGGKEISENTARAQVRAAFLVADCAQEALQERQDAERARRREENEKAIAALREKCVPGSVWRFFGGEEHTVTHLDSTGQGWLAQVCFGEIRVALNDIEDCADFVKGAFPGPPTQERQS